MRKTSMDQDVAEMITQAIKNDEHISHTVNTVHVAVQGDQVSLDGQVRSEEEMNTIATTAMAIAVVDKVSNHLEVTHQK